MAIVLSKAPKTLGKGFTECNTRQRPLGSQSNGNAVIAECFLSGTRQSLCRPVVNHSLFFFSAGWQFILLCPLWKINKFNVWLLACCIDLFGKQRTRRIYLSVAPKLNIWTGPKTRKLLYVLKQWRGETILAPTQLIDHFLHDEDVG